MKSIKIEEEVWTQIGEWTVGHLCFMLKVRLVKANSVTKENLTTRL